MALESMKIYSCSNCGNSMVGMEWEDHPDKEREKDFKCPECGNGLNEDELFDED